jgi:hypothetical protein
MNHSITPTPDECRDWRARRVRPAYMRGMPTWVWRRALRQRSMLTAT